MFIITIIIYIFWLLYNLHTVCILNSKHLRSLTAFKSNKNTKYSTCPIVAVPTVRRKSHLKSVYHVQLPECFLQVDLCHPERNWASFILRVWRRWECEDRQNPCWVVRMEHQIYTDVLSHVFNVSKLYLHQSRKSTDKSKVFRWKKNKQNKQAKHRRIIYAPATGQDRIGPQTVPCILSAGVLISPLQQYAWRHIVWPQK